MRRAVVIDAVVALAAFALSVSVLAVSDPVDAGVREPDAVAFALAAVYCASVVVRRRAPVVAVFAGLLAGVAYAGANYPDALLPVPLLSIYTAAAVLPQRPGRMVLAGAIVLGAVAATLGPGPTDPAFVVLIVAAWLWGRNVGSRRAYTAELERKNRLLERAQAELAEQAVTEERLRIARELHDVVAHTMSVVVVHAGTGRMVAEDNPAAAREALATIETATRAALAEMRQLLSVLRGAGPDAPGERLPAPGLDDLDALVADVVKSGVTVEVNVEGERQDVPAGVDLTAYRIVQEALTNVIKHAGPTHVTVAVRYAGDAVTVEVDDDGPSRQEPLSSPPTGGHGLVGMRERVTMYDGELSAGPRPNGGFRVAARLPYGTRV